MNEPTIKLHLVVEEGNPPISGEYLVIHFNGINVRTSVLGYSKRWNAWNATDRDDGAESAIYDLIYLAWAELRPIERTIREHYGFAREE